jgi:LmbE family N-acetylglucosaminyl deacetylase
VIGPLLAIFPHPDDETFTSAGVMAAATERGVPVTLVCATRGEMGESAIPGIDSPERLGAVRERELRNAMREIGVTDVRMLGYRDSGMEGSAAAEHERAFVRAPLATVAAELVKHIRDVRPQAIVTFGADGIYGHPDHLHLHLAVSEAVLAAANPNVADVLASAPWQTPGLYFATMPREDLLALLHEVDGPLDTLSDQARANLGTPLAAITHVADIAPWAERKRAAIAAHVTQTGEGGPLSNVPPAVRERQLAREYFVRAPLPWPASAGELDILEILTGDHTTG